MYISTDRAIDVVLAGCALHNFMRTRLPVYTNHLLDKEVDETHEVIPGQWRQQGTTEKVPNLRGNTSLACAKHQRDVLCDFVNGPGAVPWQDRMIAE